MGLCRWSARLRGFYANRDNLHKYSELRPTNEELERFSTENPDMGEKLEKCRIEKQYMSNFYLRIVSPSDSLPKIQPRQSKGRDTLTNNNRKR